MDRSDSGVPVKKQFTDSTLFKLLVPGEHTPANSYEPLEIPFAEDSKGNIERLVLGFDRDYEDENLLIVGTAGSGKTTLLQAIIAGASTNYTPDELQIWVDSRQWYEYGHLCNIFDSLRLFTGQDSSYDKVSEFPNIVSKEIDRRLDILRNTDEPNILSYWRHAVENGYVPLPRILLILDGIDDVHVNPDYELSLERAARFGRAVGINVILASQSLFHLSQRIIGFFNIKIALRTSPDYFRDVIAYPTDACENAVSTVQTLSPGEFYLALDNDLKKLRTINLEFKA